PFASLKGCHIPDLGERFLKGVLVVRSAFPFASFDFSHPKPRRDISRMRITRLLARTKLNLRLLPDGPPCLNRTDLKKSQHFPNGRADSIACLNISARD